MPCTPSRKTRSTDRPTAMYRGPIRPPGMTSVLRTLIDVPRRSTPPATLAKIRIDCISPRTPLSTARRPYRERPLGLGSSCDHVRHDLGHTVLQDDHGKLQLRREAQWCGPAD